jgi:3-hydroxyisobutyrate dehydrogenase-like beta-hydroxyacid dehydrogenase
MLELGVLSDSFSEYSVMMFIYWCKYENVSLLMMVERKSIGQNMQISPQKIAFIGLGVMGYPMAGHLAHAGHDVIVYNRTREKAERWQATYAGKMADTPAQAAAAADIVLCCLGNDDDLRSVVLAENGLLTGLKAGSLLIDHTTASVDIARELAAIAQAKQVGFLDAPVSGGQVGAEQGILTIMVGGEDNDFNRAKPILNCFARLIKHMGAVGQGQLTKMVNQICAAGVLQGLAEGLHFAQKSGLDSAAVIDVISKGAAQSWQMDNRADTMLKGEYDFGFAVDWMRKDLSLVLAEARQNGASLASTALIDQFYADVQAMGGGRWDTSSLLARLTSKT